MLTDHGGNIKKITDIHKIPKSQILDFSSNINPLGLNPKIKPILKKSICLLNSYPDPECNLAREALSGHLNINKENILLGNGSNELIHLIPAAIKPNHALILSPAFSEYELSIKLSGGKPYFIYADEKEDFQFNFKEIVKYVPKASLVIIINPNNPTGSLCEKEDLLNLAHICEKNNTYLLIDEVFMDFVENNIRFSLIKEAELFKNLLVLRSLTKFYSLPGLRIGYLISNKELIKKISHLQPTWSVNTIAQEIITKGLFNANFIKKTISYVTGERKFLYDSLTSIEGIQAFQPSANFIFCRIGKHGINSQNLSERLLKYKILIRNCANFKGLDNHYFRVAVRRRKDNLYLIRALKEIFK